MTAGAFWGLLDDDDDNAAVFSFSFPGDDKLLLSRDELPLPLLVPDLWFTAGDGGPLFKRYALVPDTAVQSLRSLSLQYPSDGEGCILVMLSKGLGTIDRRRTPPPALVITGRTAAEVSIVSLWSAVSALGVAAAIPAVAALSADDGIGAVCE